MRRSTARTGFTLIEMLITVTVIGGLLLMALPRAKDTVIKESVRGARRTVTTQLAQARGVAASRGCPGVIHFRGGSDARVWVTSCTVGGTGTDTVGTVQRISDRFGVTLVATADSLRFAPTGVAFAPSWTSLSFQKADYVDSLAVSPVGRAVW